MLGLTQAKQQLEESLRMNRSCHGDTDHPDIAAALHGLGSLSLQAGDLTQSQTVAGGVLANEAVLAWR